MYNIVITRKKAKVLLKFVDKLKDGPVHLRVFEEENNLNIQQRYNYIKTLKKLDLNLIVKGEKEEKIVTLETKENLFKAIAFLKYRIDKSKTFEEYYNLEIASMNFNKKSIIALIEEYKAYKKTREEVINSLNVLLAPSSHTEKNIIKSTYEEWRRNFMIMESDPNEYYRC